MSINTIEIKNQELRIKNYEKRALLHSILFKTLRKNEIALSMICWR